MIGPYDASNAHPAPKGRVETHAPPLPPCKDFSGRRDRDANNICFGISKPILSPKGPVKSDIWPAWESFKLHLRHEFEVHRPLTHGYQTTFTSNKSNHQTMRGGEA